MAETHTKKDRENKKAKAKKDKATKKQERKLNNDKGKSLDEMMAYVDFDGNLTAKPPDISRQKESAHADTIRDAASPVNNAEPRHMGFVIFFDDAKRYGFIKDSKSGESVFVLGKNTAFPIKKGDKVSFDKERGLKGLMAINVQLILK